MDAVCELTGWPVGHAYVPEEGNASELVPTAIWHGEGEKYARLREVTMKTRFRPGIGLPGMVWQTKDICWIEDIASPDAGQPAATLLASQAAGGTTPVAATHTFPQAYTGWQKLTSKTTGEVMVTQPVSRASDTAAMAEIVRVIGVFPQSGRGLIPLAVQGP